MATWPTQQLHLNLMLLSAAHKPSVSADPRHARLSMSNGNCASRAHAACPTCASVWKVPSRACSRADHVHVRRTHFPLISSKYYSVPQSCGGVSTAPRPALRATATHRRTTAALPARPPIPPPARRPPPRSAPPVRRPPAPRPGLPPGPAPPATSRSAALSPVHHPFAGGGWAALVGADSS